MPLYGWECKMENILMSFVNHVVTVTFRSNFSPSATVSCWLSVFESKKKQNPLQIDKLCSGLFQNLNKKSFKFD